MLISFRQCLACLLMVLLPLQAFAGVQAVSCSLWMQHCPGQAGAAGCCDHGAMVKHLKAGQDKPAMDDSARMASCAGATTCAPAVSASALPQAALLPAFAATPDSWLEREPLPLQSHIPDGLRRPPRFLA